MADTVRNNPFAPDDLEWRSDGFRLESQLQSKCALWFWNEFPAERRMLFHVDNNSYNAQIGSVKKSLGVVAGPSDFIFIVDSVIFIEMKLPGKTQTPEQIDFMDKVCARGHEYYVIEYYWQFVSFINKRIAKYYGRQQL